MRILSFFLLLLLAACGPPTEGKLGFDEDAGASVAADASVIAAPDAGEEISIDAGGVAGASPDAGLITEPAQDAGLPFPVDAGTRDAGTPDAGANLRIVVLSDLNGSYGATTYDSAVHAAITTIKSTVRPDLVLITGDMVAGQQSGLDYAAMWRGFHAAVTTPLTTAGIPVAPAPGNHDASAYAGFQAERDEYQRQWSPGRLPAVQMVDATNFPFRYSFTVKGAFFVAIDATTVAPLSGAQRTWVEQQLRAASAYRVKLVYGHVPLHPTTVGRETEVLNDSVFEDVLRANGAVFIGGHQHGYFPGVANGVRHVVTPCIGAGPRPLIGTTTASPRGFVVLDVAGDRITSLEARTGLTSGFASTITRASLPPELRFSSHLLTRDDRAGY